MRSNQSERENMMLYQPISKVIPKMAIPTIFAFLITSIYNLADTYFVSALGTNATAAVSVNAAIDQIIMMAGSMLAVGANSYIARLLGAKKKELAEQVLATAFFLALGIGAVFMICGTIFLDPLVQLLGATPTSKRYAVDYATYVLLAAPFMAANFVMNQCLRSEGSAVLSMVGMGFGGVLNCFLDPIFIFGLNLGVAGASMATAISKFVSFVILIFPYISRRSMLRLSVKGFKPSSEILCEVVKVGLPSTLRNAFAVISGILLNNIAGGISDAVLAGIGVSSKIMMFPFSIVLGFGTGFQPVAGFNWGAKRYDRVADSYYFSTKVALLGSGLMALALGVFAPQVIALFAESDVAVREIGIFCVRLQCIALPVHAWVAVVNMLCSGLGQARKAFLLATARQGSCFLPVLYPMAYLFGAYGVASVQAVADMLTLLLAVPVSASVLKQVREGMRMEGEIN